jgi:hypothetical protein
MCLPVLPRWLVLLGIVLLASGVGYQRSPAAIRVGPATSSGQKLPDAAAPPNAPLTGSAEGEGGGRESTSGNQPDSATNKAEEVWSPIGLWRMQHPAWKGPLVLREDGTFARAGAEDGRWTLAVERGRVLLVLIAANGETESAVMINENRFRGTVAAGPFELRRGKEGLAGDAEGAPKGEFKVASAMFGSGDNRVDVTPELRRLVKDGRIKVEAPWNFGSVDPEMAEEEDLIVQYRIGDRTLTARFRKTDPIVLPKE